MSAFLRLLRVELSRLLHRRAVLVLVAVCVVLPAVIGVVRVFETAPSSDAEVAEAQRQLDAELANGDFRDSVEQCVADPENFGGYPAGLSEEELEQRCTEDYKPRLEWYLYQPQLDLAEERDEGSGIVITVLLGLALMLVGTTFTGHDWASGSVSNQLLFEPRRSRVWAAKAVVVTAAGALIGAVVLSSYWLGLNAVAASRDLPAGGALLLDCLQAGWRGAGVVGGAAFAGFALTMLFRSTVATLGVLFGIALLGGTLLGIFGFEGRWNPAMNVLAVVADGTTYYVEVPCEGHDDMGGGYCSEERRLSFGQGAAYLGTTVGAAGLASLLWFRRRDVP